MRGEELLQQYNQTAQDRARLQERMDQISMFLEFDEKDELINMILSKETSVGIIKEEHMDGHINMDNMIMTFIFSGQLKTAKKKIFGVLGEFRKTMSIDGDFIRAVAKQEMRYSQHLYTHQEPPVKKGLFGRRKTPDVVRD